MVIARTLAQHLTSIKSNIAFYFDKKDNQELGNTEQYLIDAFNADANSCLICIETIGTKEAVSQLLFLQSKLGITRCPIARGAM